MQSISDHPWLASAMDFNLRPLTYMDSSWLKEIPGSMPYMIQFSQYSLRAPEVSKEINKSLKLHGQYYFDFEDSLARVVLNPPGSLKRTIYTCGLGLMQISLRKVVKRDAVRRLYAAFTAEDLEFVTRRASRFTKGIDLDTLPEQPENADFKIQALILGLQCFANAYAEYPENFKSRLILKLPKPWKQSMLQPFMPFPDKFCEAYICRISEYVESKRESH